MTDSKQTREGFWKPKSLPALALGAVALVALPAALTATTSLTSPSAAIAAIPGELPSTFADLVEKVAPAVVHVRVDVPVGPRGPQAMPQIPGMPQGPGIPPIPGMPPQAAPGAPVPPELSGLGSGFIIDPDGFIVTNNHVVGEASKIVVTMDDGEELEAELIGRDPKTDLALIKVETDRDLPTVKFGNSEEMRVGDWVLAVGSPFGLGGTVTTGILSAVGRDIGAGPYDDFLQIDAAINRGNSGGPAFNLEGEVIGINTAIFSPSGGSVGIGFAIPSEMAQNVIEQLRDTGSVARGWLGVNIQMVTDDLAEGLDLPKAEGALVANVSPSSPAEAAGVRQGDVILDFNGEPLETMRELPRLVAKVKAGNVADMTVWRNGEKVTLSPRIGALPDQLPVRKAEAAPALPEGPTVLGMKLAHIDDATRQLYRLPEHAEGVVVTEVDIAGPAARTGLRPGDRILKIGDAPVKAPDEVVDAVNAAETAEKRAVLMLVGRDQNERFVAIALREA